MASAKQIAANQRNARKSTGPRNTHLTRDNAMKHGLLAAGITELDRQDYPALYQQLVEHYRPEGPIETWLVERIGLLMVRLQRAARVDSDFVAWRIKQNEQTRVFSNVLAGIEFPDAAAGEHSDNGHSYPITTSDVRILNDSLGRYETSLERKLYNAMHELERLQRKRQGEAVPAPLAADLNVQIVGSPGDAVNQFGAPKLIEANVAKGSGNSRPKKTPK